MHILFLTKDIACAGAERVASLLANHWAGKGWDVSLVTYAGEEDEDFRLNGAIRRLFLNRATSADDVRGGIGRNALRLANLIRILKQEKPDVAIGFQNMPSCLLALAGRPHGGLNIGTERVHPPFIPLGKVASMVRQLGYGRLDAVVAQTAESAEWIQSHTSARYVPVISNPIAFPIPDASPLLDPAEFQDASRLTLLAAGRLVPQKGFDRLLRAFARVAPRHPGWRLAIAGRGPLLSDLEALARDLGVAGQVKLLGRVGNMGDWYKAADAFVLTSRFEGFPNVLCEAMAYGLPVVSVDCETGPRAIVTDGHDGLLVGQDDPDALAAAMDRLMGDASLRHRLGENASAIRERLSTENIAGQWEALFSELRARRAGRVADQPRAA